METLRGKKSAICKDAKYVLLSEDHISESLVQREMQVNVNHEARSVLCTFERMMKG